MHPVLAWRVAAASRTPHRGEAASMGMQPHRAGTARLPLAVLHQPLDPTIGCPLAPKRSFSLLPLLGISCAVLGHEPRHDHHRHCGERPSPASTLFLARSRGWRLGAPRVPVDGPATMPKGRTLPEVTLPAPPYFRAVGVCSAAPAPAATLGPTTATTSTVAAARAGTAAAGRRWGAAARRRRGRGARHRLRPRR